MADLVFGIAKPLVLGTLNRAQLAIEEEEKIWKCAKRDLVYITGEFQVMHHVLSGSTTHEKSDIVSPLVTQVRDLAYDIEDGIEFVFHLDTNKSDWLLRSIPRFMRRQLPLDEAADIMVHLKVRVQDVSQRIERYKLITDSVFPAGQNNQPAAAEAAGYKHIALNRKQQDMDALARLITQEKSWELRVISVWAANGDLAGAKSIIKKAYDNSKNWENFYFKASIRLVHPFNLGEFIKSLLDQINASTCDSTPHAVETDEVEHLDQVKLIREFKRKVNKNPYLLVLEDISVTKQEWNTILEHLPDNKGSRIFVSTQKFETARICTGYPCFQRFSTDLAHCVFFKVPLIGRVAEAYQLRCFLAKARVDNLQVISVWGIAGAGKSALVRNFYREKLQPNSKEFRRHIWVDVSYPFILQDFCRSLLLQFRCDSLEGNEDPMVKCIEDPVVECQGLLMKHQCLLVIDNLQSTKHWDLIHEVLAFRPSKSVIIVITNEERIALHCADREDVVLNVKALESGEAVDLFKRQVERNIRSDRRVLKELVSRCGGLPKVMVAVADSLADTFKWMDKATILNKQFISNLETRSEFVCLRDLFGWIHSYIRSGSDLLKPCIFYLSMFLQSQITRRRRLVMRWVAEGYARDKTSDSAEELFTKITELSMIQPAERTVNTEIRMVRCQINPFFQEYIISRTSEQSLSFALEVCTLKECSRTTTPRTARHIVIEESWQRDKIAYERIQSGNLADGTVSFARLRSLTVFGEWKSYFISESMTVLRVLDLENASGVKDEDLKKMLELLPRLKFLSLRGCRAITKLPSSVVYLRQLQTLDLRYTSIIRLPASITKLKKLQYLRAGNLVRPGNPSAPHTVEFKVSKLRRFMKPVGVKVTSGVEKLTMLHTLGVVSVGSAAGKDILEEIKKLTHLCKLGVFGVKKGNIKEFCSAISNHSHLQSLSVWFNRNYCSDDEIIKETTEPPKTLQSLKLYRLANKLPVWIDSEKLRNIRKMNLEIDELSEDDIGVIGRLGKLSILRLRITKGGNKLQFGAKNDAELGLYRQVKILEIASSSGSLEVSFYSLAMENLEVLKAGCCRGSVLQFIGLNRLKKLMEIYVIGSHDDRLMRNLEEEHKKCSKTKPRLLNVPLEASATQESTTGGNVQHSSFPF